MTNIEVLLLKGASPSSTAITLEVLATANRLCVASRRPPAFRIALSGSGRRAYRLWVDAVAEDVASAQLVIVPGLGMFTKEAVDDGLARPDAKAAAARLRKAASSGAEIASSCSGTFLLAAAGLLNGRRATTTWWLAPLFRQMHPSVRLDMDSLVVRDGPVTTAGAAMAQMDLMLSIVARHAGVELADACARYLLLDQRWSQSRFMALSFLTSADERVNAAEKWARQNLEQGFTMGELANAAGLAPRTFARRVQQATGLSPLGFVQRLRLEIASNLLETTRLSIDTVAAKVGYADGSALRRLIRRTPPTARNCGLSEGKQGSVQPR